MLFMGWYPCCVRTYLHNNPSRIIEEMVRFAYTGHLRINRDNVIGAFHLALIWKLDNVVEWCADFIASRLVHRALISNKVSAKRSNSKLYLIDSRLRPYRVYFSIANLICVSLRDVDDIENKRERPHVQVGHRTTNEHEK